MKYANEYLEHLEGILGKIKGNEEQYRETAAAILERVETRGDDISRLAPGMGYLLALEMFYRAGGPGAG